MKKLTGVILKLLLAATFSSQSTYSQDYIQGKVVYKRVLSFKSASESSFQLLFSSNKSIFIEQKQIIAGEENNIKLVDEFNSKLKVKYDSNKPRAVYTNFIDNKIVSRENILKDGVNSDFLVEENIQKVKWTFYPVIKSIGKFECQKAVCRFRGRNYIAWFTREIPVKFGPWKLNGLPGLIIKVIDEKKEVSFSATLIEIPFKKIDKPLPALQLGNKKEKKISLKDYVTLRKKQSEEYIRILKSKLPKGATIESHSVEYNAAELIFEWETEKEEN